MPSALERLEELRAKQGDLPAEVAPNPKRSKSEQAMSNNLGVTPEVLATEAARDIKPANIDMLEKEISRKDLSPEARATLIEEHNRIKDTIPPESKSSADRLKELQDKQGPLADESKKKRSYTEKFLQSARGRLTLGALSPFTGAAQLAEQAQGKLSGLMGVELPNVVQKGMAKVDEMKKPGGDNAAGELAETAGAILSPLPLGAAAKGVGLIKKALTNAGIGATTNVAIDAGKDPLKAAVIGAGAGGAVTAGMHVGGNLLKAVDIISGLPGSAQRFADRFVKKQVGERRSPEVVDALMNAGPMETAGQAVASTPGGVPLVAMEKKIARTPGGTSANFDELYRAQGGTRTPEEAIRNELFRRPAHRGSFNLDLAKETGDHLPSLLNPKISIINALLKGRLATAEPKVMEHLSWLLRNPERMADVLRDLPPSSREHLMAYIERHAPMGASTVENQ